MNFHFEFWQLLPWKSHNMLLFSIFQNLFQTILLWQWADFYYFKEYSGEIDYLMSQIFLFWLFKILTYTVLSFSKFSSKSIIMDFYFQEEALRQKRLASSRSEAASSAVTSSSNRNEAFSVSAMNPDATALSTTYIYAALVVLVLGIIIGKWIFWTIT